MPKELQAVGTDAERKLFTEVKAHYDMAEQDLRQRVQRKNGFDDADKLFNNFIDESRDRWPYQSVVFDPRIATAIWEKNARLIANKPKGRLVPREGADELGAFVNNELLSWQWDEVSRVDEPMVSKIAMMDLNARRYGAGFAVIQWRYECRAQLKDGEAKKKVVYDGPFMKVLKARDVLANPSYDTIRHWFSYRDYTTLQDLRAINAASRSQPKYRNLDLLAQSMAEDSNAKSGDQRSSSYLIKNKTVRGLEDFLGRDTAFKTVEIITEMRPDRWVVYAPKHGIILQDIPNPYKHGEIPVVMLRYNPLGDDLYGFAETEQVARVQKAINALVCQYLDTIQTDLYPPVMVDSTRVNMHTLEFGPNTKWMVSGGDPRTAIARLETSSAATSSFTQAYSLLVGSLQNALGEASAAFSNLQPFGQEKTATEIKDTGFSRTVRDNSNQIYLSEVVKKIIMFWHSMNQQFIFALPGEKQKVIRIVGRDAIKYLQEQGLDTIHPTDDEIAKGIDQEPGVGMGPEYPVISPNGDIQPKLQMDDNGQSANLVIEKDDLTGDFDYIPDIESMRTPSAEDTAAKLTEFIGLVVNPAVLQMLQMEGKQVKMSELLVKAAESTKVLKDADQFFENMPQQQAPVPGMEPGMPEELMPQPMMEGGAGAEQQQAGPTPNGYGAGAGISGLPTI
jgi:hypothetical protein